MSLMELKASEIDDTIHPGQRCRKQSIANCSITVRKQYRRHSKAASIITGYSLGEMIDIIEQDLSSLAFEAQSLV